jgi:hypothetical protein
VTIIVVITKDRQPRSFRWTLRRGVNQPNECGLSRAGSHSNTRKDVERLFGLLTWLDAVQAGVDERNGYVIECARVEVVNYIPRESNE